MTINKDELRRLAEAVSHPRHRKGLNSSQQIALVAVLDGEFRLKANPTTILALLDELEAALAALKPFADYGRMHPMPGRISISGSHGMAEVTREDWKRAAAMQEQKP
jgi:hypothetical protein